MILYYYLMFLLLIHCQFQYLQRNSNLWTYDDHIEVLMLFLQPISLLTKKYVDSAFLGVPECGFDSLV